MKNIARILVLLLVIAMMVSTFAACNKNKTPTHQTPPPSDENTVTTPSGNGGNVGGGEEETTPANSGIAMPDKIDMNGYTYRAYVRSNVSTGGDPMEDGNPSFYCEDFWIDTTGEEPEDALSYAVYMRNKAIENDYNVKIRQENQTINTINLGYTAKRRCVITIIQEVVPLIISQSTPCIRGITADLICAPINKRTTITIFPISRSTYTKISSAGTPTE